MREELSWRQLNRATLQRQSLLKRDAGTPAEVIGRLAGLQAQHANSPYIALWSRREGQSIVDLEAGLTGRTVVKATLMRTTLHLVDSRDFWTFDAASAPPRLANWGPTAKRVDLDLVELNATLLEFCAEPRTVAEIEEHLAPLYPGQLAGDHVPAGVRNTSFRLASAAGGLVHVPPSGLWKSHGKPSYVDARRWLGEAEPVEPGRAVATTVERYLAAYGPTSVADIVKWAGQRRVTPVKAALTELGDRLRRYAGPDGVEWVDLAELSLTDPDVEAPVRFLSRWDSALIGYDERRRILADHHKDAVIKKNGDFLPTFLVDGFVAGLWSVETGRDGAVLTLDPFEAVPKAARSELEEEAEALVHHVAPEADRHKIEWVA